MLTLFTSCFIYEHFGVSFIDVILNDLLLRGTVWHKNIQIMILNSTSGENVLSL